MLDVPRFAILWCYRALLLPYLMFALPLWAGAAATHIQRLVVVQNNAIRRIFGLRSSDSTLDKMKDHNCYPLVLIIARQTVRLIWKLSNYFPRMFSADFQHLRTGHNTR